MIRRRSKWQIIIRSGITLIALIITIIVLLILAGISIAAMGGNDSPIEKAGEAKNQTGNSINQEENRMNEITQINKNKIEYSKPVTE